MTTTPGPRLIDAEALKAEVVRLPHILAGGTSVNRVGVINLIDAAPTAEARADVDGLVARLREALALRPSGRVGPERIPWFTHTGISHGEGAECYVCALLAGDKADARRFFTHDEAGDVYTDLPLVAGDKAEAPE